MTIRIHPHGRFFRAVVYDRLGRPQWVSERIANEMVAYWTAQDYLRHPRRIDVDTALRRWA